MRPRTELRLIDLWPPSGGPKRDDAEHEILRQAIRLFGRRGYGATSMRTIAAEAAVTAPLIGYHFGSKEGLFHACVDVVMGSTIESLRVETDPVISVQDLVRQFAARHVEFSRNHPEALRFILTVAYGPEENQPAVDLVGHWRPVVFDLLHHVEGAIDRGELVPRRGATPAQLVRHLLNHVHMEAMSAYDEQRFLSADPEMVELFSQARHDVVDDIVAQFFHGAGALRGSGSEESDS